MSKWRKGALSPLDVPVVLPDDMDCACRHMVTMGQAFDHWQRKQLRILGAPMGKLVALESFFKSRRTDAAKAACVSVQPHVLDAASRIMNWPDVALPWLATVGVPIVGKIPPSGIFRTSGEGDVSPHQFESSND